MSKSLYGSGVNNEKKIIVDLIILPPPSYVKLNIYFCFVQLNSETDFKT